MLTLLLVTLLLWLPGFLLLSRLRPCAQFSMARPSPSASVIIPARNEERNLPVLLRSIQAQSVQPAEVIVVDDESTDRTAAVARELGATVLRKQPVRFTRSRAYHKDDNAHVEQKNWTHVRQWLGYQRLDHPQVVSLLNRVYKHPWRLFHNFFCPSMKLLTKERIGSQTIKRHSPPKTPYHRVLESPLIASSVKQTLTKQFETLNPFVLRETIERKLGRIYSTHAPNYPVTLTIPSGNILL